MHACCILLTQDMTYIYQCCFEFQKWFRIWLICF